jgi:hypothetical protein
MMKTTMDPLHSKIMPNSTQIPNYLLDELLPRLKHAEFKVLIVITRQTLGWVEDLETGRRKDRDWISNWQMQKKTGCGHTQVSAAIKSLIDTHDLIEAFDADGNPLETAAKRQRQGGQIFYRLKTRPASLFDKPPTLPKTGKGSQKEGGLPETGVPSLPATTKETLITKEDTMQSAKPIALSIEKKEKEKVPKTPSPHKQFVDYWYRNTKRARRFTPIITGADAKNLKRILDNGIEPDTLEKAAIYFLHDPGFKKFSPSISTFLSSGIITGLIDRMTNEPGFWKKIEQYLGQQGGLAQDPKQIAHLADQFAMLKNRLASKMAMPYRSAVID